MPLPRTPRPHRPVGRRASSFITRLLGKLGRADIAIGPAELGAIYLVFFLVGFSIGGTFGGILWPLIGGLGVLICRLVGAIVALFLVKPARKIRARWGYLGIAGAVLLAILVSCGTGSVGQIASLRRATSTADQLERGDNTTLTTGPARGCQIAINEFNLGLLSEEEMREQCGDSLAPREGENATQTRLRVEKPNPLLFVWAGIRFLVVVGIVVFIFFKKP